MLRLRPLLAQKAHSEVPALCADLWAAHACCRHRQQYRLVSLGMHSSTCSSICSAGTVVVWHVPHRQQQRMGLPADHGRALALKQS